MRILGLDYGEKRIGVAISDPTEIIAQRLSTIINYGDWDKPISEIAVFVRQYGVQKIVIGLPKNMNGTIGLSGQKTLKFAEQLKSYLYDEVDHSVELINWDERLTTAAANRTMSDMKTKKSNKKKLVDQIAAVYILQGYLDSL